MEDKREKSFLGQSFLLKKKIQVVYIGWSGRKTSFCTNVDQVGNVGRTIESSFFWSLNRRLSFIVT
jgi:hypothetical protein